MKSVSSLLRPLGNQVRRAPTSCFYLLGVSLVFAVACGGQQGGTIDAGRSGSGGASSDASGSGGETQQGGESAVGGHGGQGGEPVYSSCNTLPVEACKTPGEECLCDGADCIAFEAASHERCVIRCGADKRWKAICADSSATSALWGVAGELWDDQRFGDFSYAGYRTGEKEIPTPAVVTNVKDYGAKGDGVHNDLGAFQAAIDATNKGVVWIPKGVYRLAASGGIELRIDRDNVVVRGEGSGEEGSVLRLESSAICQDGGNQGSCYGTGVFRFGTKGRYENQLSSALTTVVANAKRGQRVLKLASADGIQVGDLVVLYLQEDGARSLGRHLMADKDKPTDMDYNDGQEENYYWPVRVAALSGNEVTLAQPLRVDVRSEWKPSLRRANFVKDVGIEGLRFEFPEQKHPGHFLSNRFNAVDFNGVVDGWMRDIRVSHGDLPLWVGQSKNVTVRGIRISKRKYGTSGGHHGITFYRAADCLFEDFVFETKYIHDVTIYGHSNGNVVRLGSGVDLNIDFHTRLPHENLITAVNFGNGTRAYASAGPSGRHHAAGRNIFWGNESANWLYAAGTMPLPSDDWGKMMATIVSAKTDVGTSDKGSGQWGEHIPGLFPRDLYRSQQERRLP